MKKRYLITGILFLALMLVFILSGNVNAVTSTGAKGKPLYLQLNDGKYYFFANGVEITIDETKDGKTIITDIKGNEWIVDSETSVIGGMHNDDTPAETKIVMNGGQVRNIIGGGLHKSNTTKATIIINDGKIGNVSGGGYQGLTASCTDGCTSKNYSGEAIDAHCRTESAYVEINGGTFKYSDKSYGLVYGGGCGISYTGTSTLKITDGDMTVAYVTGGGSNGITKSVNMEITGGEIGIAQSINRGIVNSADVEITGGEIENLYVCGEDFPDVTGILIESIDFSLTDNAKVEKFKLGKNADTSVELDKGIIKAEDIVVDPSTLADNDENKEIVNSVITEFKVKIDSKEYKLAPGKTIKDLAEYKNLIKKEGYIFEGLYNGKEKFDENTKITSNLELTTKFTKIISLKNCIITQPANVTYNGKAFTPEITVKYNDIVLKENNDYVIKYLNNTNPGKATVEITGKGYYSETIAKTFLITPNKLTGLKVSDKTTSKIKLTWTKHEGVTGYKVYSYNSSKKKWEYVGKTDKTTYTIAKLKSSTKYEYRVRAYKNIDGTQYFGSYATSVKTATAPKTPSVKVKAGDKKVTFTWNKVSGASGYRIYMSTSKNGKYERIKTISNNKTFKYTKSGLKANKKYYFKVRAYKTVDDEKVFSSYTKVLTATTKKVHVVKKGNTLYSLAKKYKTTVAKLVKINNLKKASAIRIGFRLLLN